MPYVYCGNSVRQRGLTERTRQEIRVQSLKRRFISLGSKQSNRLHKRTRYIRTGGRSRRGLRVRRAAHSTESGSSVSSFLPLDWPPSVCRWPPFNSWVPPAQVFLVLPIAALGRSGFVAGCWPPAVYPGLDSPEQGPWHRGNATVHTKIKIIIKCIKYVFIKY